MAYVAVSNSPIRVRQTSGPVDPGYGQGGGPVDPGYGIPDIGPIDPGFGVGLPPIASHPLPPSPGHPSHPLPPSPGHPSGQPLPPTYPVDPGYDLPLPPHVWPQPPRPENPDPDYDRPIPIRPDLPIYLPPTGPDNELPMPPGAIWPPLPPGVSGQLLCFVWIVGAGWRWTVIDTELSAGYPLVPPPAPPLYPSNRPPGTEHPSGQPVLGAPNAPPATPAR